MGSFTPILWIFIFFPQSFESTVVRLEGVERYEVVRPLRLHELHKRDTQTHHPSILRYGLTVEGEHVELHLEKNEHLLAKDYVETRYTKDGEKLTTVPQDLDHCYYHGRIHNDSGSSVSISTCTGIRGFFKTRGRRYLIEPLSEQAGDTDEHAVYRYESLEQVPAVCGVTNTSWDDAYPKTSTVRSRASGRAITQDFKYIELFIVADNLEYKKMKSSFDAVRSRVFEILNFINVVYKPLRTFVALVGLEVWTDTDKIQVTAPAGQTLDAFTKWRNAELVKTRKHDNAQLLTAIDFEGATVGLAFVATLCSGHSTGVIQDHSTSAIAVGATLAHEMGHNLGMSHDSTACVCSEASCIMAPALSYNTPKLFSSCSFQNYHDFLTQRNPECLLDKPDKKDLYTDPVCGNGFVERGEQCDCGTVKECTNPCCDAQTCMLEKEAQCAEGPCCENCKIMSAGIECRKSKDDCDLPEFCTGESNQCPEDVFTVNGAPCQNGQGYCYNGDCPTLADQCRSLWGSGAVVGEDKCFDRNTQGTYYEFCKRTPAGDYVGCQKKDVKCGKLFCSGGNYSPSSGTGLMFWNCKASFFRDKDEEDKGLVQKGIKCGNGQVCSGGECSDIQTVYKSVNCSDKCTGHAQCNHKLECQCEPGWFTSSCHTQNPTGLSKGSIIGIAVSVCCLLLVIFIGVLAAVLFIRKKKQTRLHRPPTSREVAGLSNPSFSKDHHQKPLPSQGQYSSMYPPQAAPPAAFKPGSAPSAPPSNPRPQNTRPSAPPPSVPVLNTRPPPSLPNAAKPTAQVNVKPTAPPIPSSKPAVSLANVRAGLKPVNNPKV
ncbi:zinc metalloproteinase-disintegrin-like EoMP06 isoform X1 [Huso huso]|uniref:Zinc metalloproteinase-disintegrin-like EoMP06 isoform X1 n=1 Tax=Huso huso TaxID=61971 RepID=A0ABR0Y6W8_HUSHU